MSFGGGSFRLAPALVVRRVEFERKGILTIPIARPLWTPNDYRTKIQHSQTNQYKSWQFSAAIRFHRDHNKMLSYRRETALQGALQFSPKVEDWN